MHYTFRLIKKYTLIIAGMCFSQYHYLTAFIKVMHIYVYLHLSTHTNTEEVPKFQFLFSVMRNTISDMHVIKGIRNAMCCVIANAALRPLQNNYYRKNAVISLGTKSSAPMSPNLRS